MQHEETRRALEAIGTGLGPDTIKAVFELYDDEQSRLQAELPITAADLPYGSHEKQKLDLYRDDTIAGEKKPIMLFVHGGGFLRGGKREGWKAANVGRMAAKAGFLGVVMGYRLAPEHTWPSGADDILSVLQWLRTHAGEHGGDASQIVLVGTSAGSVHIATYLQLYGAGESVKAAVLLSGLYGFTPLDDRDCIYYGPHSLYEQRRPLEAMVKTELPLMVFCAQWDPQRFREESYQLAEARKKIPGRVTRFGELEGHNHYSMAMHLGSSDTRLSDELIAFAKDQLRN